MVGIVSQLSYYWNKALKRARGTAARHSRIDATAKVEPGSLFIDSTMGRHSFCGYDCEIASADIGAFCSIANRVAIGGGQHPMHWVSTSPVFYEGRDSVRKKYAEFARVQPKKVSVGADVWIGFRAIVMQGVSIGPGAVVGANAVVTRDVPAYAIVAGVPAKIIGYRFAENLRERLLASEWWERPDSDLETCAKDIRDPEQFLARLARCA